MGENRACRYEPDVARVLERREGRVCVSPPGKADRIAGVATAQTAGAAPSALRLSAYRMPSKHLPTEGCCRLPDSVTQNAV